MEIKYGITGNYYAFSKDKNDLIELCTQINKAVNSIYWNTKYEYWVIRIKSKVHKKLLKGYCIK